MKFDVGTSKVMSKAVVLRKWKNCHMWSFIRINVAGLTRYDTSLIFPDVVEGVDLISTGGNHHKVRIISVDEL